MTDYMSATESSAPNLSLANVKHVGNQYNITMSSIILE